MANMRRLLLLTCLLPACGTEGTSSSSDAGAETDARASADAGLTAQWFYDQFKAVGTVYTVNSDCDGKSNAPAEVSDYLTIGQARPTLGWDQKYVAFWALNHGIFTEGEGSPLEWGDLHRRLWVNRSLKYQDYDEKVEVTALPDGRVSIARDATRIPVPQWNPDNTGKPLVRCRYESHLKLTATRCERTPCEL